MDAINWHSVFFLLFALVTGVFSIAVVATGNVVRMAFYLLIALGATAGLADWRLGGRLSRGHVVMVVAGVGAAMQVFGWAAVPPVA